MEEQIQALRQEFQGQIDSLKTDLATKDAQLKQAQQAAADAQAAADQGRSRRLCSSSRPSSDNAAAVTTLQSTVTDLKGNQASLATTVSDETAKIKKDSEPRAPSTTKASRITPGQAIAAAETVWRTEATGGGIPTAFSCHSL